LTVHDATPHALAWLGAVYGVPTVPVGVEAFGESGTIPQLYERFGLLPDQLVNAGLVALSLA
jgi:pyruvate dehydrogenase E1 component